MSISGYERDADSIYAYPELVQKFKKSIRIVKDGLPGSDKGSPFYRSVLPFFEEFNVQNGYQAHDANDFTDKGNSIFSAIQSGLEKGKKKSGRKYAAALLAWMCWKDSDEASKLYDFIRQYYEDIGELEKLGDFQFRAYEGEPASFEDLSTTKSKPPIPFINIEKIASIASDIKQLLKKVRWIMALTVIGLAIAIPLDLLSGFDRIFSQNDLRCGKAHNKIDRSFGVLRPGELKLIEKACGPQSVQFLQEAGTVQYVTPIEFAKAIEDQISASKMSEINGSRYLAQLYFTKAMNEVFFNRAEAIKSFKMSLELNPHLDEARTVLFTTQKNVGVPSEIELDEVKAIIRNSASNSLWIKCQKIMISLMGEDWSEIEKNSSDYDVIKTVFEELSSIPTFQAFESKFRLAELIEDEANIDTFLLQLLEDYEFCQSKLSRKEKAVCYDVMTSTQNWNNLETKFNTSSELLDHKITITANLLDEAGLVLAHARLFLDRAQKAHLLSLANHELGLNWREQEAMLYKALNIVRKGGDPYLEAIILDHLGYNVVGYLKQDQKTAYELIRKSIDLRFEHGLEIKALKSARKNHWREVKYGDPKRAYFELERALKTLRYEPAARLEDERKLLNLATTLGYSEKTELLEKSIEELYYQVFELTPKSKDEYIQLLESYSEDGEIHAFRVIAEKLDTNAEINFNGVERIKIATSILHHIENEYQSTAVEDRMNFQDFYNNLNNVAQNQYELAIIEWDKLDDEYRYSLNGQNQYAELVYRYTNVNKDHFLTNKENIKFSENLFHQVIEEEKQRLGLPQNSTQLLIANAMKSSHNERQPPQLYSYAWLANYLAISSMFSAKQISNEDWLAFFSEDFLRAATILIELNYNPDKNFGPDFMKAIYLQELHIHLEQYNRSLQYSNDVINAHQRMSISGDQLYVYYGRSLRLRAETSARLCEDKIMVEALEELEHVLSMMHFKQQKLIDITKADIYSMNIESKKAGCDAD